MEYSLEMAHAINEHAAKTTELEQVLDKMYALSQQKYPIKKYNEYTEQYAATGEMQGYEDALRDSYEEMEHALDNLMSKVREGGEIPAEKMEALTRKIENFKSLLPI